MDNKNKTKIKAPTRHLLYAVLVTCIFCGQLKAQKLTEQALASSITQFEEECYKDSVLAWVGGYDYDIQLKYEDYIPSDVHYFAWKKYVQRNAIRVETKGNEYYSLIYLHKQPTFRKYAAWLRKKYGY